ncbi:MucBP domain-containing protein [Enterococcus rotai]|uniref:MucBP domain-containing protein n=1 Tax=Enterococcus rotai TaxID=118060 RepID=UPI0035C6A8C9
MEKKVILEKKTGHFLKVLLVVLTFFLAMVLQDIPAYAKTEGLEKTESKGLILKQNEAFPTLGDPSERKKLFSSLGITEPKEKQDYHYVDEQGAELAPTSEAVGFQQVFIEASQNTEPNNRIRVPVTVTNENTTLVAKNQVALQLEGQKDKVILSLEETASKSPEELSQLVKEKTKAYAWKISDGTEIPVIVSKTTIKADSVGKYSATFDLTSEGETIATVEKEVLVFGGTVKQPIVLAQNQDLSLEEDLQKLFSNVQSTQSTKATDLSYQLVDQEGTPKDLDSSQIGFQWGYIKLTDKKDQTISSIVKVPITVVAKKEAKKKSKTEQKEASSTIDNKVGVSIENPQVLTTKDLHEKTEEQLVQQVKEKMKVKAWTLDSGNEIVPQIVGAKKTGSDVEIKMAIPYENQQLNYTTRVSVYPEGVFEGEDPSTWQEIPLGSSEGVLTNPLNGSKIGFYNRGMEDRRKTDNEVGFRVEDREGNGYVHNNSALKGVDRISDVIGVDNNRVLYSDRDRPWAWSREHGLGYGSGYINENFDSKRFLRKENRLKEILTDSTNKIVYVYNLVLQQNLNFSARLDVYNLSDKTRSFSLLESVDIDYLNDKVPVYSLANSSGFYFKPDDNHRFSIRFKDSAGNWLSDYRKYKVGSYTIDDFDYVGVQSGSNYFGNSFSSWGTESEGLREDQVILTGKDSVYQLGAPWKDIAPGEALRTGYEVFAGEELPYMKLQADPNTFNVYQDFSGQFQSTYTLSQIPVAGNQGTINMTYPDGSKAEVPFTANASKVATGSLIIPRTALPAQLNADQGTIKSYNTNLLAINKSDGAMNGLPSNDYSVKINVYHLGGKPIGQTIRKNSSWTKSANSLIKDPVILPGHTAKFEYVNTGKPVDTSKVGLQYAEVRMTDINESSRTTIIKVPVYVYDGSVPKGLVIGAHDIVMNDTDVANMNDSELKRFILNKSEAIALDLTTVSTEGIDLTVQSTTLTNKPDPSKTYSATIQAKKGSQTITKDISITVKASAVTTKIAFYDNKTNTVLKDKEGKDIDSINYSAQPGATINLDTITKDTIDKIKGLGYEVEGAYLFNAGGLTKIQDPTAFVVPVDGGSVIYKFKKSDVTTTIAFYDNKTNTVLKDKEGKDIESINYSAQPGAKINLDTIANDTITKIKGLGYEVEGVYSVSGAGETKIQDPTAFVVPAEGGKVIYKFTAKGTLTINFKDADGKDLSPVVKPIIIEAVIGTEIDLSKNEQVIKALKAIKEDHYQLVDQPSDKIKLTEKTQTVTYKFDGKLFIESAPSVMSFGKQKIQKGIHFIKVTNAEFDTPLIIWDSRKKSKKWNVTATLQTPFTNVRDSAKTLPDDVLRYKKEDNSTVKFKQGDAEILAERTSGDAQTEYTLSEDWKSGKTGFRMEIPTDEVESGGDYQAKILWQVGNTP